LDPLESLRLFLHLRKSIIFFVPCTAIVIGCFISLFFAFRSCPVSSFSESSWSGLPLSGGGMANDAAFKGLERQGLLPVQPDIGMDLLMQAISHPSSAVITVCPMNTAKLPSAPYFRFLRRPATKAPASGDCRTGHGVEQMPQWLLELREMEPLKRRESIRCEVALVVAGVGVEGLEGTTVWGEAGLDSLGMVEVRNGVVRAFENAVPLGATALFDYPTLNALVEHIEATLCPPSQTGGDGGRLPILPSATGEAVAVVGMACRFPGGGNGPEAFWRMLVAGVDGSMEIPMMRMDWRSLYVPDGSPGSLYTNQAGLIDVVPFTCVFFLLVLYPQMYTLVI